ncbi:hypothetical protein PGTUg99_014133 [Puccinia graminis f. sp. tritici]|uniref:Uncharacterized protein n=1 Tax=Puccinia graminis f. sp. tritici TaxID=56615 RepID=A0A5B0NWA8_PUCGR|nr:hypothetical protein PGTUg99_014133 [Puccinia graminis f. sp. tritici]
MRMNETRDKLKGFCRCGSLSEKFPWRVALISNRECLPNESSFVHADPVCCKPRLQTEVKKRAIVRRRDQLTLPRIRTSIFRHGERHLTKNALPGLHLRISGSPSASLAPYNHSRLS